MEQTDAVLPRRNAVDTEGASRITEPEARRAIDRYLRPSQGTAAEAVDRHTRQNGRIRRRAGAGVRGRLRCQWQSDDRRQACHYQGRCGRPCWQPHTRRWHV